MTAAALNELNLESGTKALFREFLSGYFDGLTHSVGGIAAAFPKARFVFDQAAPQQPIDDRTADSAKVEIHLVSLNPSEETQHYDADGKLAQAKVSFHWWARSRVKEGGGDSRLRAQTAAELLRGLLNNNAATYPLALRGIRGLKARKPEPVRDEDWAIYLVTGRATLQWRVNEVAP